MNITDFIPYFGYPSQNQEFSKLLDSLGVKERPVFNASEGTPMKGISFKKDGFFLDFINGYEDYYGAAKETGKNGEMIFYRIFAYFQKEEGFEPYKGTLPVNLTPHITPEESIKLLGTPFLTRDEKDDFGTPGCVEHHWKNVDGFRIVIIFLKKSQSPRYMVFSPKKI